MSRVIQIRDVPDDVHDALCEAARARGLSLTKFVVSELKQVAERAQIVQQNAELVRAAQARVKGHVDRKAILAALNEDRGG